MCDSECNADDDKAKGDRYYWECTVNDGVLGVTSKEIGSERGDAG